MSAFGILLLANLYGADKKDPQDITNGEWKVILESLGRAQRKCSGPRRSGFAVGEGYGRQPNNDAGPAGVRPERI